MEVLGKSDIGKKRVSNQDNFAQKVAFQDMAWSVVCDGMGGLSAGEVASKKAVDFIAEYLEKHLSENSEGEQIRKIMYDALTLANEEVYNYAKENPQLGKMGTTVVICIVKDAKVHVSNLGDSRAYVVGKKTISQISVDHSVVQKMIDSGELTPEEAQHHPQKNIITRALGIDPTISVEYNQVDISKGDRILLCTDGLTNYLNSLEILDIFNNYKGDAIAEKLVEESNNRGGKDNITVSIIEI